ncbi:hypothetical protein CWATWH0003_5293 [Crocosphaera watsonii WH 0003]|uniref:Uncharacterized protein n=1 Tax=Crocosphaera watsonii WH 0003 TaxID=423471 RepID=G5JCZ4_CROWT|nr:hypothetical protein CWATWH0003_5293 [Crocosphaera watsonii WH 0003]
MHQKASFPCITAQKNYSRGQRPLTPTTKKYSFPNAPYLIFC